MIAKIETLRTKDENDKEYFVYPRTLIRCLTNENGDNLEDSLQEFLDEKLQDTYAKKEDVEERLRHLEQVLAEKESKIAELENRVASIQQELYAVSTPSME